MESKQTDDRPRIKSPRNGRKILVGGAAYNKLIREGLLSKDGEPIETSKPLIVSNNESEIKECKEVLIQSDKLPTGHTVKIGKNKDKIFLTKKKLSNDDVRKHVANKLLDLKDSQIDFLRELKASGKSDKDVSDKFTEMVLENWNEEKKPEAKERFIVHPPQDDDESTDDESESESD